MPKDHPGHITQLFFKFKNDTKGALRYDEVDEKGNVRAGDADGAFVGTLYLRKAALKGKVPKELTIDLDERPEV